MRAEFMRRSRRESTASSLCDRGAGLMKDAFDTADEWDAGDLACGELVLELRKKLRRMPGGVLKVTALDSSAPVDLPAWCRLTSNELVHHDPAAKSFWIKSRMNWN